MIEHRAFVRIGSVVRGVNLRHQIRDTVLERSVLFLCDAEAPPKLMVLKPRQFRGVAEIVSLALGGFDGLRGANERVCAVAH